MCNTYMKYWFGLSNEYPSINRTWVNVMIICLITNENLKFITEQNMQAHFNWCGVIWPEVI